MKPKFVSTTAWQQAELLMQPVFIRVIDNIRKELEASPWHGTYQDVPIWADGVSAETKAQVALLQQELKGATPAAAEIIKEELARLPQPFPGYQLCLKQRDREVVVDLWDLCYQICFRNYNPVVNQSEHPTVEIDTSLIDETGDVDWQQLDTKTHSIINQIFTNLPIPTGIEAPGSEV